MRTTQSTLWNTGDKQKHLRALPCAWIISPVNMLLQVTYMCLLSLHTDLPEGEPRRFSSPCACQGMEHATLDREHLLPVYWRTTYWVQYFWKLTLSCKERDWEDNRRQELSISSVRTRWGRQKPLLGLWPTGPSKQENCPLEFLIVSRWMRPSLLACQT